MKENKNLGINTICTHVGEVKDEQFKGAVSPIYMSTVDSVLHLHCQMHKR